MKLSGNRFIESVVGQTAKSMVKAIEGEIPFTPFTKAPEEATFALVSTSGVHLKTQQAFDVDAGDHRVCFIPYDCDENDLMISHTHYDRADADKDVNCVFPLFRLKELADKEVIGGVAATHYGLMGYIPNPKHLITETIPTIIAQLNQEKVDAVILNPG